MFYDVTPRPHPVFSPHPDDHGYDDVFESGDRDRDGRSHRHETRPV